MAGTHRKKTFDVKSSAPKTSIRKLWLPIKPIVLNAVVVSLAFCFVASMSNGLDQTVKFFGVEGAEGEGEKGLGEWRKAHAMFDFLHKCYYHKIY